MMNEAWIEQSLARLETLETQKSEYETSGQAVPAELEEEIETLYEALNAAAEDPAAPQPAAAPAAAPIAAAPVAAAAPGGGSPFDAPAPAPAAAPFAAAPAQAPPAGSVPGPMVMDGGYDDFDDSPPKSKAPLFAIAAVAVVALGVGGWYVMGSQAPPPAEPAAPGEAKVISASSVPEDTQEPQVAKGANADRTQGTIFKEGSPEARKAASNGGGNRSSNNRPRNNRTPKKDNGRKIKLDNDRDPLAGVN